LANDRVVGQHKNMTHNKGVFRTVPARIFGTASIIARTLGARVSPERNGLHSI
jgi:hypothetical protein